MMQKKSAKHSTALDEVEIDFELEDGSHTYRLAGLRRTRSTKVSRPMPGAPIPTLPTYQRGEVYFVPVDARGQFPHEV